MKKANISTLKNKISEHIRYVRAGGTVRIYDRDEPVADMTPIAQGNLPSARLAQLEREGIIRGPARGARTIDSILASPPAKTSESVLAALLEDRQGGR